MQRKEDLMYYDFQGWPVFKMNFQEILMALGGKVENNKIVFDLNDPIMKAYPVSFEDDGMAYGVKECVFTCVDVDKHANETNIHFFRDPIPKKNQLEKVYARWDKEERLLNKTI